MSDKHNDFINGLIVGGVVGVVLGLMVSPDSGQGNRKLLLDKVEDIKDLVTQEVNKFRSKGPQFGGSAVKEVRKKTLSKSAKRGKGKKKTK